MYFCSAQVRVQKQQKEDENVERKSENLILFNFTANMSTFFSLLFTLNTREKCRFFPTTHIR